MLKKILLVILILLIIGSTFAYMAYKKIEAQFDSFMMSEVQKRNDKIDAQLKNEDIEEKPIIISKKIKVFIENLDTLNYEYEEIVVAHTEVEIQITENVVVEETTYDAVVEETTSDVSNVEETVLEDKLVEETYSEEEYESDKAKALSLAMSRLSTSQITKLLDISKDGFTPEERQEAKIMFYSNFTLTEQEWILDVYGKHYPSGSGG